MLSAGFPSFFCFGIKPRSCSNFMASTVRLVELQRPTSCKASLLDPKSPNSRLLCCPRSRNLVFVIRPSSLVFGNLIISTMTASIPPTVPKVTLKPPFKAPTWQAPCFYGGPLSPISGRLCSASEGNSSGTSSVSASRYHKGPSTVAAHSWAQN